MNLAPGGLGAGVAVQEVRIGAVCVRPGDLPIGPGQLVQVCGRILLRCPPWSGEPINDLGQSTETQGLSNRGRSLKKTHLRRHFKS